MKKKIKIFSTIASLCLAVALMAFGVYAAKTASLGITSKVTFTADDVYVTFNAKQIKVKHSDSSEEVTSTMKEVKSYSVDDNVKSPLSVADYTWTSTASDDTGTLADLELTTEYRTVKYEIKITNDGLDAVKIAVTNTADTAAKNFKVSEATHEGATLKDGKYELAAGGTYTFTISASIDNITSSANYTFDFRFDVTR